MPIAPKPLKLRTSNLTHVLPGTVRTWHPQIFPKRGVFKNLLGGDMHSHERLLVLLVFILWLFYFGTPFDHHLHYNICGSRGIWTDCVISFLVIFKIFICGNKLFTLNMSFVLRTSQVASCTQQRRIAVAFSGSCGKAVQCLYSSGLYVFFHIYCNTWNMCIPDYRKDGVKTKGRPNYNMGG